MRQPSKWWVGLPAVAGLAYFASAQLQPEAEADLARRVGARLGGSSALSGLRVSVEGRDATLSGVAMSPQEKDAVLAESRREKGARSVADATSAVAIASPFVFTLERKGAVATLSGATPVLGGREAILAAIRLAGVEPFDQSQIALGAPAKFADYAHYAARRLGELDPAKITVSGASIDITGEARGDAEYDAALAAIAKPPEGAKITRAEIAPPRAAPFVFGASRAAGIVTLSGHIPSNDQRKAIGEKASAAASGGAVQDSTRAGSGAPKDFAAAAAAALGALSKLEQGKVALSDQKLSIEGQGRDNVDAAAIETAVKAELPQGYELARVDVAAGAVSPYAFAAQKGERSLALSGHAPDEAARAQIVEAARRLFPGAEISNQLKIAKGAPRQFTDASIAALRSLARLQGGKATISGVEAALDGTALYDKAVEEISAQFPAGLPQGFRGSVRLAGRVAGSRLEAPQCRAGFAEILSKAPLSFERDAVSPASLPALDALAALALRCDNVSIEIAAHSDAAGIEEVNRGVTKRRAQLVADHLIRAGADAAKISAAGYGSERPLAPNDSEENRAKNRRVEFVVR